MGSIKKINFPFLLSLDQRPKPEKPVAVFFGADFYNLPLDSNRQLFIERTNQILEFIRARLPNHQLVYQPHPNETDEYTRLNLERFVVGERTIAEIYLYENARTIDYVFSAQSGASISAFAMGFNSVIFLGLLHGALSEESITGYRSYFAGLPNYFFMKSFDAPLPRRAFLPLSSEMAGLSAIGAAINPAKTLWVLANEPSFAFRLALLVKHLRAKWPNLEAILLIVDHPRWQVVSSLVKKLAESFNEVITLPHKRIWYGIRPKQIIAAIHRTRALKHLPLKPGDNLISLWSALFEENCLLSYHPQLNKILLIENRWYKFVYEAGNLTLPTRGFRQSWGVRLFNHLLEPMLGLKRTIYREYKDGKVLNIWRYALSPEKVYDTTLVLMPGVIDSK